MPLSHTGALSTAARKVLGALGVLTAPALFGLAGCHEPRSAHDVQSDNPLGPSFWLIPVPSDDSGVLGSTFARPPDTGRTLEEQSSPNPCAERLAPPQEAAMTNHYENAVNTSSTVGGQALLRLYGFGADVSTATHLLYRVDTARRISRLDTTEYLECCRSHDYGWGYVSALIYGEGDYSSGQEASVEAKGNYLLIDAGAQRAFRVLHTRRVRGYLAAVLTSHDRNQGAQACPPGQRWTKLGCKDSWLIQAAEQGCASGPADDPDVARDPQARREAIEDQRSACDWLRFHGLPLPPGAKRVAQ